MIYTLPKLDPIAFNLGFIAIRWYSLAYILGMIYVIWWLKSCNKKQRFLSDEAYENWLTWAVLSVIIGGRLGYVLFYNFGYFFHHPAEIFAIWQGGMSFHGGLFGAIFGMWIFAKKYKANFFTLTDHVAVAAPVGLFFGRIANFVNMELYGRATNGDFGVIFPGAGDFPRHPSQLYEATLEGFLLFLVMNWLFFITKLRPGLKKLTVSRFNEPDTAKLLQTCGNFKNKNLVGEPEFTSGETTQSEAKFDQRSNLNKARDSGRLSGIFLIGYGLARALVENFREPDSQIGYLFGSITMGQILSLPLILAGFGIFVFSAKTNFKKLPKNHKSLQKR